MPTKVLVFESDAGFAEQLRKGLSELDCSVTVVDDASVGLQTAARDRPDLILLAIELPRMNGFSVCNKLKRDPGLKDVPLIIMSSDSTDETFEQHRRLRTRAEDYVHKPIDLAGLIARIQPFVRLGAPSAPPPVSEDAIVIEDDLQIDDDAAEVTEADIELETDALTDQAFESLVSVPPPPASQPSDGVEITEAEVLSQPPVSVPLSGGWSAAPPSLAPTEAEVEVDLEIAEAEVAASQPPGDVAVGSLIPLSTRSQPPPSSPPRRSLTPASFVPSSSPMASVAPRSPSLLARAAADGETQRLREELERQRNRANEVEEAARAAQARIDELEDTVRRGANKDFEVQRLQRELDDVKARAGGGGAKGGGSPREFLDLREQLNKKDKELLDLRDQLTHRDKELLALRDSLLAHERDKADLHDRVSEFEKQQLDLNRTNEALKNDKEAASKRAEDFKRKSDKLKTDLDAKISESNELKAQLDAELLARTSREAEFEARAQADLEKAVLATEASERERAEQALAAAREEARVALEDGLAAAREEAAQSQRQALSARDAELRAAHIEHMAAIERGAEETLLKLRAEHDQSLLDAESASQVRLAQREAELIAERGKQLEAARLQFESERAELIEAHAQDVAARDQIQSSLERDLAARTSERDDVRRDLDRKKLRIEGLETDLSMTRSALEAAQTTLAERERALASATSELFAKSNEAQDLATRLTAIEVELAELSGRHASMSAEFEQVQSALARDREILARARNKWEGDRAALERTKDALAAALAQVDDIEARTFE